MILGVVIKKCDFFFGIFDYMNKKYLICNLFGKRLKKLLRDVKSLSNNRKESNGW